MWSSIKLAIEEMLTDNGYTVFNSSKIARTNDTYVVVVSGPETNNDKNNYVGVGQYRNMRNFILWTYTKNPLGIADIDLVRRNVEDIFEEILVDFKAIFNSTYNKIGDAGGILLKYEGMEYKDVPAKDMYAPIRMEVKYSLQYIEDRKIS